MYQEKIQQIARLYAAGNPTFLDHFRAIQTQLSVDELWQLVHLISGHLEFAVNRAEAAVSFSKAA